MPCAVLWCGDLPCGVQVQDVPWEDLVARFAACFEFIDKAVSQPGGAAVAAAALWRWGHWEGVAHGTAPQRWL